MDGPIPFDYFTVNDPRPLQIAIKLFLKNPIIDVRHTLCAGGLFWMLDPGYSIYTLPMTRRGQYGSPNDYGITSHPLLPGFLNIIPVPLSDSPLIWKPAFYLYLFLFCLSILIFRSKSIKIMLISTPIIIQTLVMILVNYANDFRYIFSTELCAILMVGVILLPKNELQKTDPNHKNEHVERI